MDIILSAEETRILGCLMEKALSTPDYYPLSLNALTNACNQKSSRDPVVAYSEETVQAAVEALEEKGLVEAIRLGRVTKFEERFSVERKFVPAEIAVLCVLLLRGPQTAGEIRTRTTRLYPFQNIEETIETLDRLKEWGYVQRLAREPGRKEARHAHLLGSTPTAPAAGEAVENATAAPIDSADGEPSNTQIAERIAAMEQEIDIMRAELSALTEAFQSFRQQFE